MGSLFGSTQPQAGSNPAGSTNSGLFGGSSLFSGNTASRNQQFSGLGSFGTQPSTSLPQNQGFQQNAAPGNAQRPVVDSRSTVRQLTALIPEWKGHFDLAELLISSQEQTLNNVGRLVSELGALSSSFETASELTRSALGDISLQQNSLSRDLAERVACQDAQNLTTIKSRRLCEALISNQGGSGSNAGYDRRGGSVNTLDPRGFKVPNHVNVQLARELYDRVRQLKAEVEGVQNEVQMLKDIDIAEAPNFIESVLASHQARILALGNCLTRCLNELDLSPTQGRPPGKPSSTSHEQAPLYEGLDKVWANVTGEISALRRNFLDSVGVAAPTSEPPPDDSSELKRQIRYLKRFNASYNDASFPYARDLGYNIKDLLTNPPPGQGTMMPGNTTSNLFGTGTSTGASGGLFGSTTGLSNTGTSLYGTGTGLFGGTGSSLLGGGTSGLGTSTLGSSGLGTTGSNLAGSTSLGGAGLFGSTNTGTGLFATASTANTTGTGATGLFGSSTPATTATSTGTGLFGSSTLGQSQSAQSSFGTSGNTSTGLGLFGAQQAQNTQQTGLFGSTSTGGGLFGSTSGTTTGGSGLFGASTNTAGAPTAGTGLFGSTPGGTNTATGTGTSSGLFGSSTATNTATTGLFGSSAGSTLGSNTGAFGASTSTPFGAGTTNAFGSTSTGAFGGGGSNIFGSGSASTSSLFGGTQPKSTGTELALYNPNPFNKVM